jgi:hypothetical protein
VTASITMLPEITVKVGPPRALEVPYPLGFPFGAPGDAALQLRILRRLLGIARRTDVPLLEVM